VDEIKQAYCVVHEKPQEENTSHIVLKVQTLSRPLSAADALTDKHNLFVCDCRDYQFNQGVDLESKRITEWGNCKHVRECSKSARAEADDSQSELDF